MRALWILLSMTTLLAIAQARSVSDNQRTHERNTGLWSAGYNIEQVQRKHVGSMGERNHYNHNHGPPWGYNQGPPWAYNHGGYGGPPEMPEMPDEVLQQIEETAAETAADVAAEVAEAVAKEVAEGVVKVAFEIASTGPDKSPEYAGGDPSASEDEQAGGSQSPPSDSGSEAEATVDGAAPPSDSSSEAEATVDGAAPPSDSGSEPEATVDGAASEVAEKELNLEVNGERMGRTASCEGNCAGYTSAGDCWCDDICSENNDCCEDKNYHCPAKRGFTGGGVGAGADAVHDSQYAAASCGGKCGDYNSEADCACDDECGDHGNCCENKEYHCPSQ